MAEVGEKGESSKLTIDTSGRITSQDLNLVVINTIALKDVEDQQHFARRGYIHGNGNVLWLFRYILNRNQIDAFRRGQREGGKLQGLFGILQCSLILVSQSSTWAKLVNLGIMDESDVGVAMYLPPSPPPPASTNFTSPLPTM
jgi:hypothetical protein